MRLLRHLFPALLFVLAACGSTSSGLVDDLELMPVAGTPGLLAWSAGASVRANRMRLEPVLVTGGGAHADLATVGGALRQILVETCGATLPVTATDGPGVVLVRLAIDDVRRRDGLKTDLTFGDDLSLETAVVSVEMLQGDRRVAAFKWPVADAALDRGVGPRWGRAEEAFRAIAEQVLARVGSAR